MGLMFSGVPGSPSASLLLPGAPLPTNTPVNNVTEFSVEQPDIAWSALRGLTTWSASDPLG